MYTFRKLVSLITQEPLKMVFIVRADLKLSKGKTGSQCAHAAIMCYQRTLDEKPDLCREWLIQGQPKIVLKINNVEEIRELETSAVKQGLITAVVRDAGRTEIPVGTITVMGIGPDTVEKIDLLCKHLKLL